MTRIVQKLAVALLFLAAITAHALPGQNPPGTVHALTIGASYWTAKMSGFAEAVLPSAMLSVSRQADRLCLALAVYHEARGEPAAGQHAVVSAIVNRMRSSAYPDTACKVVYQGAARRNRCQFSFACDLRPDLPGAAQGFARSLAISDAAHGEPETCFGTATHYHRHDVAPSWSRKLRFLGRIGDHVFFASDRVLGRLADGEKRIDAASRCQALAAIAVAGGMVP